ncbi:MAG: chemotaxis protein CheW [Nitrospirales bacterium]
MLRSARGQQQAHTTKRSWNVVVFSIGGLKLAARTEDVGSVSPWTESIPVPSRTPFVQAMLKRGNHVMPVYDLASRLSSPVQGDLLLCLEARHVDGPMAICIDADVPSLETVDATTIRPNVREDVETLGMVTIGGEDVAIVALQRLGRLRQDAVRS